MEERDAFKPRTQPKSRAKEIPGARMETDGQGVNRQAETERERGQGHPGFYQGHRDTGLQRMENQESQEGTEPGPRSSREVDGGGRGRPGWMVPKGEGCRRGGPRPLPTTEACSNLKGLWHPWGAHRREQEVSWIPCILFRHSRTQLYPKEQSKSALWGSARRSLVGREDTGGGGGAPRSG